MINNEGSNLGYSINFIGGLYHLTLYKWDLQRWRKMATKAGLTKLEYETHIRMAMRNGVNLVLLSVGT